MDPIGQKVNLRNSLFNLHFQTIYHYFFDWVLSVVSNKISHNSLGPDSRFTIIDENGVLFQQSPWSFLQPLQLIYRYGILSMLKLHYFIQGMLEDFANIYPFLNDGHSVDTVEDMLKVMSPNSRKNKSLNDYGMLDLVEISLENELLRQSQPQNLIDELVTVAVRVNYGQMPDSVHAFVGSVALAGKFLVLVLILFFELGRYVLYSDVKKALLLILQGLKENFGL